jgi:hypothetical protein
MAKGKLGQFDAWCKLTQPVLNLSRTTITSPFQINRLGSWSRLFLCFFGTMPVLTDEHFNTAYPFTKLISRASCCYSYHTDSRNSIEQFPSPSPLPHPRLMNNDSVYPFSTLSKACCSYIPQLGAAWPPWKVKESRTTHRQWQRIERFPQVNLSNASGIWNWRVIFFIYSPAWRVLFPPLSESFFPANWVLFLPDSEIQTHTWHGDLFVIMTHSQSRWSIFRVGLVQTKCTLCKMLSKDMILASFSLIWQVNILSYSPVWRVPWKS